MGQGADADKPDNKRPKHTEVSSLLEAKALDPFLYYDYRLRRRHPSYQPVREGGNNRDHLIIKGQNIWKYLFDRCYQYANL